MPGAPATRPGVRSRPRSGGSRRVVLLGVVLVGLGVAVLAYVGWQQIASNWWSWHRQDQLVEELEETWQDPAGREDAVAAGGSTATAVVRIPRFGTEYAVPVVEGTGDDQLALGLGHLPGSAGPGEPGNLVLAGHRIGHGEPLRDLPDLQPGDEVVVETRDGVHTYVVDTDPADLSLDDGDTWVTEDLPVNPDPGGARPSDDLALLTLLTCTDLFHSDGRTAVFGHLVTSVGR